MVLCLAGFVYFVYRSADDTQRKLRVSTIPFELGIALFRDANVFKNSL